MLRLKLISFQAWVFSATGNMLGITIANPNGIHLAWLEWDELLIQGENTIASWCAIQEVSQRPGEQLQKILMMYRSYPKFHFPFGPDEYNRQFHIILSVPPFLCPCALRVKRVFFWLFILLLDHYLIGLVLLVLVSSPSLVWSFRIVCRISSCLFSERIGVYWHCESNCQPFVTHSVHLILSSCYLSSCYSSLNLSWYCHILSVSPLC